MMIWVQRAGLPRIVSLQLGETARYGNGPSAESYIASERHCNHVSYGRRISGFLVWGFMAAIVVIVCSGDIQLIGWQRIHQRLAMATPDSSASDSEQEQMKPVILSVIPTL